MKLATVHTPEGTRVAVDDGTRTRVLDVSTMSSALSLGVLDDPASFSGREVDGLESLELAAAVTDPGKVFCVGLNYREHILEMGKELPAYPDLFAKFAEALIGPQDEIQLDSAVEQWDWEAELVIVIGREVRHADEATAARAIAGYTVGNDISARDWQWRVSQWVTGKTFEATSPIGPWIVTPDEFDPSSDAAITTHVDGVEKQRSKTSELLFTPVALVQYLSSVITLKPGDIIFSGTPGGVGSGRVPQEQLSPGSVVTVAIEGIGECRNVCSEPSPVMRAR
ncbi:MAG TPA: fumarylacetoacetate hydrolase family protein [Pseudolysinimonas sp.]|nr:fumarylacetoacetate hydrolase family protein [Pseudolysinimonas sp.]